MSRKTLSLTVAGIALVLLVALALIIPVPYVVMSPGITENVLGSFDGKPIIVIDGHKTYPTTGHLNLTTVSVTSPQPELRLSDVISAWLDPNRIVLPRDVIYPPQQSVGQVEQQNRQEMVSSQSSAAASAMILLGYHPLTLTIDKIEPGAPADGVLHQGDTLKTVDGKVVNTDQQAVNAIQAIPAKSTIRLGIVRGGKPLTKTLVTADDPQKPGSSRVGVVLGERYTPPFTVSFNREVADQIGGPSAGTMFSLAIYDMLTPGPLTDDRFIAGTGTMSVDGVVGPIGGIQQKMAGAYAEGAQVFLSPKGDCKEALGSQYANKMELVQVTTLASAIKAIKAINAHHLAQVPRCGGTQ
ncbi:MAG: YlbL family protein [Nocardioidaceae bacterium]